MKEVKFKVEYEGKSYQFKYGSEVYIFHTLLYNDVEEINLILEMIEKVELVYLKDENQTPLGALTDFIAENWILLKEESERSILAEFYKENL